MKVLHVCFTDSKMGGAIGARRLHLAMLSQGVDSWMLVARKNSADDRVLRMGLMSRILIFINRHLERILLKLDRRSRNEVMSLNLFPTGTHREINRLKPDVVQLHWVNYGTIAIHEIPKIRAKVVWKLADMWAFNGASHYEMTMHESLPATGKERMTVRFLHCDWHKIIMEYKRRCWFNARFVVVTPSRWLHGCASVSGLFRDRQIVHIINPIDLEAYHPVSKRAARQLCGLPPDGRYILFASVSATSDPRKGYRYLTRALETISDYLQENNVQLLVLGDRKVEKWELAGIQVHSLGFFRDVPALSAAYNAADIFVLPTLADNLPNTVQEAMSCGTPCVGFRVGGIPDMIEHEKTGYLASPGSTADLANGIVWLLNQDSQQMAHATRKRARYLFSPASAVNDYLKVYRRMESQDMEAGWFR